MMEKVLSNLGILLLVACLSYASTQEEDQQSVDQVLERAGQELDSLTCRFIGLSQRLTTLLEEDATEEETANRLFSKLEKEGTAGPCKRGFFPCGLGPFGGVQCVRDYLICDGTADCRSGADESGDVCGKCTRSAGNPTTAQFKPKQVGGFLPWFCCGGQVWTECVRACTRTCDDQAYFICSVQPKTSCAPGCQCPSMRPTWHEGRCVARRECVQDITVASKGLQSGRSLGGRRMADLFLEQAAKLELPQSNDDSIGRAGLSETCTFECPNGGTPTQKEGHKPESNGCGSYGIELEHMNNVTVVKECCDVHDVCYETCNESHDDCDDRFKQCLLEICDDESFTGWARYICQGVAIGAHIAVQGWGCPTYLESQGKACDCPAGKANRLMDLLLGIKY